MDPDFGDLPRRRILGVEEIGPGGSRDLPATGKDLPGGINDRGPPGPMYINLREGGISGKEDR